MGLMRKSPCDLVGAFLYLRSMKKPEFDFKPLFFILDKNCKWALVVEKQDQYSYSGTYLAWQEDKHQFQQWPAYMNRQDLVD